MRSATASLLSGPPLRRALLALAAGNHIRVRESPDGTTVAVTRPAGTGQKGTYLVELASGKWGLYRREVDTNDNALTDSGFYRLLRQLDVDLSAIARAIGD